MTKTTYTEMVDSGIEWIGKIPKGWEVIRNRHIMKYAKGKAPSEFFDEAESGEHIPYLSMEYLRGDSDTKNYVDSKDKCVIANNGDLLLLRDGSNAGEFIEVKYGEGVISSTLAKLDIDDKLNERYYFYLSKYFEPRLKDLSIGMGIPHVSGSVLKDLPYFLFDKKEQQAIATYLDTKKAQIDQAISLKTQQIKMLQEKRTALINHVVTKGLDPDVELADSGIEWIGEIPKGWEVRKLKYGVTKVGSGVTPKGGSEVYGDEGIMLLRSQNIYNDGLRLDDIAFISEEIDEEMKNSRIECGDVLLNITGASIGRSFLIGENFPRANVNQHVCIIRPSQNILLSDFLHNILISNYGQKQIDLCQNGSNREGLNFQNIKNFTIIVPSFTTQQTIASYLDTKTAEIDQTIALVQKSIDLLVEYKQSLISHVVTGKVKV